MIERVQEFANVLVQPLVDPASRTFVPYLIIAAILGVFLVGLSTPKQHRTVCGRIRAGLGLKYWRHPSSVTDLQLLLAHQFLRILGALPRMGSSWGLAVGMVLFLDRSVGQPEVPIVPTWMLSVGYTLVLFVVWDLSRFVLHLLLHRIPFLWSVHQVHHSAEVLTPLTFHRAHPLESLLYDLRGVLSTGLMAGGAYWLFRGSAVEFTLFGVHGLGVVCNAISGNLRHSHVWWRFGPAVERWLISPAQHQLHHSRDVHHYDSNFGTWLACWDRWMGTLVLAPAQASLEFGLRDANHRSDDLIGALVSPVMQSVRILVQPLRRMWIFAFCLLLAEGVARAEEAEDDEAEWEQSDGEMVVVDEGGVPRIAGSAHVIDEAGFDFPMLPAGHRLLRIQPDAGQGRQHRPGRHRQGRPNSSTVAHGGGDRGCTAEGHRGRLGPVGTRGLRCRASSSRGGPRAARPRACPEHLQRTARSGHADARRADALLARHGPSRARSRGIVSPRYGQVAGGGRAPRDRRALLSVDGTLGGDRRRGSQ